MPETDVHDESVPEEEPFEKGLPPFPGEETPETEEREQAEQDASESDEAESATDEADDPQASDLLREIPEDIRPIVERYADKRIGKAQASWSQKLEQAAAERKKAEIYDQWEDLLTRDPKTLVRNIQETAKNAGYWKDEPEGPPPPQDPGPPPVDAYDEPEKWQQWYRQQQTFNDWKIEQALKRKDEEWQKRVEPIADAHAHRAKMEEMQKILSAAGVAPDEFQDVGAIMQEASSNPAAAWKIAKELNALRKQLAGAKKATARKTAEKIAGSEESAGLPSAGKHRAKPAPTGNFIRDIDLELAHDGVKDPFAE